MRRVSFGQIEYAGKHPRGHQRILVQQATGVEVPSHLVNKNIPLHDGQQVTAVSGYKNGADSGYWSLLVNHTAQRYWFMLEANEFRDRFRLTTGYWPFTVVFVLLPAACLFLYSQILSLVERSHLWAHTLMFALYAIAMVGWLIALITKIVLNRNMDRSIAAHLHQLGKALLTQPPAP